MLNQCENCIHHMHLKATISEPREDWCELWNDYYYGERDYDCNDEELGCENFREEL